MDPNDYMKDVLAFYDDLSEDYHLIYEDWWESATRQARALDRILADRLGTGPFRILDCTCGIGTQALGLAQLGHRVTGSDLSSVAVKRARREAAERDLDVDFHVWDVREVGRLPDGPFDVVLSADNSLPHLTERSDLLDAVRGMWQQTAPDGATLVTLRDYDQVLESRPQLEGPRILGRGREKRIVLQLWKWDEQGRSYELLHFILRESDGEWKLKVRRCEYRALTRDELGGMLRSAGADETDWIMPEKSGFHQPILWASSSGAEPRCNGVDGRSPGRYEHT